MTQSEPKEMTQLEANCVLKIYSLPFFIYLEWKYGSDHPLQKEFAYVRHPRSIFHHRLPSHPSRDHLYCLNSHFLVRNKSFLEMCSQVSTLSRGQNVITLLSLFFLENSRPPRPGGGQSVTVPRIFSGTGTGTFFRDQFFPVPGPVLFLGSKFSVTCFRDQFFPILVPVLFSGTNFFRYRNRYFFPGPNFSDTGTGTFFRD